MMEQDAMLGEFYDAIFGAFGDAGMTYAAIYQANASAPAQPCTILFEGDPQTDGEYARVSGSRIELGLRKAEVGEPASGAFVTITKTGRRYVLEARVADDEAFCRWVVGRG